MLTVQKIKLNEISSSERNGLRVVFIWLWWLELVYSSFSHPRAVLVCGAFNFYEDELLMKVHQDCILSP